jgi:hypothetical protein
VRISHRVRLIAPVFGVVAAVSLAGCAAPDSTPTGATLSPSPQHPTATATASAIPINAAVTVAGVDLNGQNVSVSGFVEGVIEAGGSCTFVLTPKSGGTPLTVTSVGIKNITTTSCGTHQVPIANFSQGPWSVVLKYSSSAANVTSEPVEMEIP